ncbi:unnamed protein product, partial [Allacma fusca]
MGMKHITNQMALVWWLLRRSGSFRAERRRRQLKEPCQARQHTPVVPSYYIQGSGLNTLQEFHRGEINLRKDEGGAPSYFTGTAPEFRTFKILMIRISNFSMHVIDFRKNGSNNCPIKANEWNEFYKSILPPRDANDCQDVFVREIEELDKPFNLSKLKLALRSLSSGKAPGPNYIPNRLLKHLPDNVLWSLLDIINNAFNTGSTPQNWSEIELLMVFKKRDIYLPANYRGIALINTVTKLFTALICKRLTKWAEEKNKLPECQAGFRKGRGCLDQIFSLMSIIQMKLRISRGKLFVMFIDFQRAFDSIPHDKLWRKLFKVGVSAKIINVMRSIYSKAKMCVRAVDYKSLFYDISMGVLQGEILSPLLFALYISDLDEYMDSNACSKVGLGGRVGINNLYFADDTVTLADTRGSLQKKIDVI